MCGFDSCYPCLMLLIFNQNRKRRNKIYRRRRGFLSKKTCLVVRRSKSFLRAKLRRFKIAFRHRLPKVKLKRRVIRQARRRFKIINTPKKRLYHFAQGARYLPKVPTSEVIFAQWISKTQSKTIFFDRIAHLVHKILVKDLNNQFIFRQTTPYFTDPSTLLFRFHTLQLYDLFEFYRPFFYHTVAYTNSLSPAPYVLSNPSLVSNYQSQKLSLFTQHSLQTVSNTSEISTFSKNLILMNKATKKRLRILPLVTKGLRTLRQSRNIKTTPRKISNNNLVVISQSKKSAVKGLLTKEQVVSRVRKNLLESVIDKNPTKAAKNNAKNRARKEAQNKTKQETKQKIQQKTQQKIHQKSKGRPTKQKSKGRPTKEVTSASNPRRMSNRLSVYIQSHVLKKAALKAALKTDLKTDLKTALKKSQPKRKAQKYKSKVYAKFLTNYDINKLKVSDSKLRLCRNFNRFTVKPKKQTRLHLRRIRSHGKLPLRILNSISHQLKLLVLKPKYSANTANQHKNPLLLSNLLTTSIEKAKSCKTLKLYQLKLKRSSIKQFNNLQSSKRTFKWQTYIKWTRFYNSSPSAKSASNKSLLWEVLQQSTNDLGVCNPYSSDFLSHVANGLTFNRRNFMLVQQQLIRNLTSQLLLKGQLSKATLKDNAGTNRTAQTLANIIQNLHQPEIVRLSLKNLFKARRLYLLSKGKLRSRNSVTNALRCSETFIWRFQRKILINQFKQSVKQDKKNTRVTTLYYWLKQLRLHTLNWQKIRGTKKDNVELVSKLQRLQSQQRRLALRETSYFNFYSNTTINHSRLDSNLFSNLHSQQVLSPEDLSLELGKLILRSYMLQQYNKASNFPTHHYRSLTKPGKYYSKTVKKSGIISQANIKFCFRVLGNLLNFMKQDTQWQTQRCRLGTIIQKKWCNSFIQKLQHNSNCPSVLSLQTEISNQKGHVSTPKAKGFTLEKALETPKNFTYSRLYATRLDIQGTFNKIFINQNRIQVSSYYLSFPEFVTNMRLRIREREAWYKMYGFRRNFNALQQSFGGSYTRWLTQASDKYFETLVDFNRSNITLKSLLSRKYGYRAKRTSARRARRFSLVQSMAHRREAFFNQQFFFKQPVSIDTKENSQLTHTLNNLTPGYGFQNLSISTKLSSNPQLASLIITNRVLYKYLAFNPTDLSTWSLVRSTKYTLKSLSMELSQVHFNSRINTYSNSNLLPAQIFKHSVRRRLFKLFKAYKFSVNVTMWYYNMLVRFMENCSGKKIYLKFDPFIENSLTFCDLARCSLWGPRVDSFQRLLGPRIFVRESLKIFHLAIRSQDPTFLANWFKGMLQRMSFWKYRLLFRYFKYVMRYFFSLHFREFGFKGLKIRLKGKVCVAGNARTRTLLYHIGETSYSTFANRISSDYSTIGTFTGVLGFRVWFFY